MKLIHPKCKGNTCGSWEICSKANVLKYGCVYYDEEAEEIEIKMELQEKDKYENSNYKKRWI